LVQADLLARGYLPYTSVTRSYAPFDIIAVDRKDPRNTITIEVRSARRKPGGALQFNKSFPMRSSRYALVVTGEPVVYLPELPQAALRAPASDEVAEHIVDISETAGAGS
jgi:hypothetical protein